MDAYTAACQTYYTGADGREYHLFTAMTPAPQGSTEPVGYHSELIPANDGASVDCPATVIAEDAVTQDYAAEDFAALLDSWDVSVTAPEGVSRVKLWDAEEETPESPALLYRRLRADPTCTHNEVVWTLRMKSGDVLHLTMTVEFEEQTTLYFGRQDAPLETAQELQALLDDIDTVWQEFSDAVILGDSRAVGFSYYSFLDASRVLASSGERIDAIDGHIEDLKKLDPAYIFLCYGINDLGWYGSAQDYADTLLEKIRLLRRELPEAVIVVSSILPAYEPAVSREKLWLQIPDYTAAVQAMCEENGVLFADNTQLSEDYADLWQPDGIHLLPEFYPHWAANLIFASWGEIADA